MADFDIESLLKGILSKDNKPQKIATPSQNTIAGLLGGADDPMSEATPIGGSSTMLPPSANTDTPDAQSLLTRIQAPQQVETQTEVPTQQVQPRPLQPPDNSMLMAPPAQRIDVQENNAYAPPNEETYLRQKITEAQTPHKTNKWAEAGFAGLQGLNRGVQQAVYGTRDNSPTVTLDELRQQRELKKYGPRLGAIVGERQQRTAAEAARQEATDQSRLRNAQAAKASAEAQKQLADIDHQIAVDGLAGKKWEKLSQDNLLWKHNADGSIEPLIDPETNKQMVDKTLVSAKDPVTGETLQVEPNQKLTNSTNLAVGNANRDVQVQTTNANNLYKTQRDNLEAKTKAVEKNMNLRLEAIKAQANILGANQEVGTAVDAMSANAATVRQLADEFNNKLEAGELTEAEANRLQKEIHDRYDNQFKLQKAADGAIGKVKGGADLVRQLNKMSVPIPKDLVAPKVQGRSVGTGGKYKGQVFPNIQTLRTAFPGKKDADIKAIVEAQGGRFQN